MRITPLPPPLTVLGEGSHGSPPVKNPAQFWVNINNTPFDPQIVTACVATALEAERTQATAPDVPDLIRRLLRLLTEVPWSADGWSLLGDLTGHIDTPGVIDTDQIAAAEPHAINAVVHSKNALPALKSLVSTNFWAIIDKRSLMNDVDVSGLTREERARYGEVVFCRVDPENDHSGLCQPQSGHPQGSGQRLAETLICRLSPIGFAAAP